MSSISSLAGAAEAHASERAMLRKLFDDAIQSVSAAWMLCSSG
jgi:hypothetical protein